MNNEITAKDSGVEVYGIKQMSYTLAGQQGTLDFGAVTTDAAIKQAITVEQNAQVIASAVKMRSRKIEDLGKMLAIVADALGQLAMLKKEHPESSDKINIRIADKNGQAIQKLKDDIKRYGVDLETGWGEKGGGGCSSPEPDYSVITLERGVAMKAQSSLQQMIDKEDNNLQQDKVTLQGFISKSDKAYEMAGDLANKINNSSSKIVGNVGG